MPVPWIRLSPDCSCRFARVSLALEPDRGSDIKVMIFRLSAGLKLCHKKSALLYEGNIFGHEPRICSERVHIPVKSQRAIAKSCVQFLV